MLPGIWRAEKVSLAKKKNLSIKIKLAVYRAIVLSTLNFRL